VICSRPLFELTDSVKIILLATYTYSSVEDNLHGCRLRIVEQAYGRLLTNKIGRVRPCPLTHSMEIVTEGALTLGGNPNTTFSQGFSPEGIGRNGISLLSHPHQHFSIRSYSTFSDTVKFSRLRGVET
jgi:hypothetical protein